MFEINSQSTPKNLLWQIQKVLHANKIFSLLDHEHDLLSVYASQTDYELRVCMCQIVLMDDGTPLVQMGANGACEATCYGEVRSQPLIAEYTSNLEAVRHVLELIEPFLK